MAAVQRKLVHKQFNSPMGLYSQQNVKETLNRELKAFGSEGIEIDEQIARPLNLANSAVLRAVEEEEQMKCEMIEPSIKCERQSRARQRFYQRPHTPVHQHQLEQIKTQYLSHQHDITIDRDTVLKINRLATRRNLHKREHSWPPTMAATTIAITGSNEQQRNVDGNGNGKQHIRSTSNDNALQFDETVCKRHGIDVIREKFNSPTRIIEPTPQEVRQRRLQQQHHQQQQQQQKQKQRNKTRICLDDRERDVGGGDDGVSKNKPKQMINLVKHQELLRKNPPDKSATMTDTSSAQRMKDRIDLEKNIPNVPTFNTPEQHPTEMVCDKSHLAKEVTEDELFKTTTVPVEKGFSHPETKAADEDIGLVQPKRQFYEQLNSYKKWHSYENLNAAANIKTTNKPLQPPGYRGQTHSLERGREARQHKQLPPQKPRFSPRLQRRSMKLATEIKISYDADAQQHNIQVKSLNQPKKSPSTTPNSTTHLHDLEHIPLPATPEKNSSVPVNVEQSGEDPYGFDRDAKSQSLKEQQIYDDSCIYLRSIDLQDNTVAYIPAAITIVPSPTEEIMQHWMESSNLKADIKGVNDNVQQKGENLISNQKHETVKSAAMPEANKEQQRQHRCRQQQQQQQQHQQNVKQDAKIAAKAETDTYVTRLPKTPNGIQLTRQTSVNTKRKTQTNNNDDGYVKPTNLPLITEPKTHESLQQSKPPGVIHSNTDSADYSIIAKEGDKIQQQGVYYTDGEYVYGPYDPYNGSPLANATVRSLEAEQQLHQQAQIKKDIEAETKSQHKNEIANLTAKYEHIQKSINEHLRQIDSYIENAKAALKSTIATGNKTETSSSSPSSLPTDHNHNHQQCNLKSQQQQEQEQEQEQQHSGETPLKEILRKITNIMQEVKPLHENQKIKQEILMQKPKPTDQQQQQQDDDGENMPIVDKVLMDLNMLTKHLSEFDKTSSEELKPIIEQLQQTPLELKYETRPTATTASHVLITEEKTKTPTTTSKEDQGKPYKSVKEKPRQPLPPTPPPLPPPPQLSQIKQEKRKDHHHRNEKLLATDKLITAQIQSQQHEEQQQQQRQREPKKEMTMSALTPKDKDDDATTAAASKDKKKNLVFDFITTRHKQEQLVEQVIDTLGKLENETKENLVNIHVTAPDEKIKSNLYQQTPSSSSSSKPTTTDTTNKNKKEKDVAIMQNCNISVLANDSSKDACNHDNDPKSTKGNNESQLKLHIKDFADKIADKQFQKYDKPLVKNTNDDMVNTSTRNNNKSGQRQEKITKNVTSHHNDDYNDDDDENKTDKITKNMERQQQPEGEREEGSSNHSSGSELSNTYKSSYELPSPYVTMRQISWEDVLATMETQTPASIPPTTTKQSITDETTLLTSSVNIVKPKTHNTQNAQSPVSLCEIEPAKSGHVQMQSTTTLKPRIPTRKQQEPKQTSAHRQDAPAEEGRKYPAPLIEPHLPTRSTSPFGLNAVEMPFKQRSTSVSPTRLRTLRIAQDKLAEACRKYPSPLVEPHLPTRATSPFGLNAVEMKNVLRSTSTSPKRNKNVLRTSPRTVDEMAIRKYPAPLAEPHAATRAASPFGLNAVDVFHITRATTPMPPAYGYEMNSEDEQEPNYYHDDDYDDYGDDGDEHEDKPTSPIRKYPPALIEPHVPKRAASPFGLNAVIETTKQKQARHRTPSPARAHAHHHHPHAHKATTMKSSSIGSDFCRKPVAYVPQVEGHNIGLLVRTSTPTPYSHTDAIHATCIQSEINATKSPHDYVTIADKDITDNKYSTTTDMERVAAAAATSAKDDYDVETCDELQRINTNRSGKQGTSTPIATNTTTSNKTMAHQQNQQQPRKQEIQHDEPEHQYDQHSLLQHQEQYFGGSGDGDSGDGKSGQHMTIDMILLPSSVINRSFDNVSPRPYISIEGYKRVAWPPASEERIVREFTPQPQTQFPPAPAYNQQQHQPTAAPAAATAVPPTQQQYRAPSYDNYQQSQPQQHYQQPGQQQQQFAPQPHYQAQAPTNQYQPQQPQAGSPYQQPPQQQQYQQPPWVQQQQPQQQYQQQPQYQNPLNQYNQAPHHQQQQQPNQFVPQTNQQQFNSYSQPQQQQHTVSHDQVDQQQHYQPQLPQDQRGASPGIITLRKEVPITQKPAPVYTSQPAAVSFRESSTDGSVGGSNMRGDLKWPPPEYKEAAAKENEERRKLALGPVCRPRKVQRDYTSFFAKNALSHHYPSYKVPPGTQHMTC